MNGVNKGKLIIGLAGFLMFSIPTAIELIDYCKQEKEVKAKKEKEEIKNCKIVYTLKENEWRVVS